MSRDHMPAAITTRSARMVPAGVSTPTALPLSSRMRVTLVFSNMRAPRDLAPAASAWVTSIGLTCPSLGRNTPPTTPSRLRCGRRSATSPAADHLHREPELPRHRGAALQFLETGIAQGDRDRAVLFEAGGLTGFGLQLLEQPRRVFGKLREIAGGAQLADKSGGMPGGARGQLLALEEHHVGDAELGEMIGERGADDAAANDHDVGSGRQRFRHGRPFRG